MVVTSSGLVSRRAPACLQGKREMVLRRGKEDSDYTVTEVHVSPLSSEAHVNSEFRSPINSPNSTAAGAGLFLSAPLDNLFSLGQKLEKCIISLEFLCAFLRLSERISPWRLVDLCLLPPPPLLPRFSTSPPPRPEGLPFPLQSCPGSEMGFRK